ncbi:hypothetical protein [Actinomadura viridis]|uniref:Uncharacterized protein n=1 Tax=Actinomadura viridis TaxID=58110 RepID=A0A931DQN7_9ACTN|nr:hypothetical protein [Actinomadura viridis]MBG6091605.1 hypothetical protein [Actinomadura viridis]
MTRAVREAVAAIAAEGQGTLVLHGPGPAGRAAAGMLPRLPEACFLETAGAAGPSPAAGAAPDGAPGPSPAAGADVAEALRQAVAHGLGQLILLGTADDLAPYAGTGADGDGGGAPLAEITTDMGGPPALAAEVAAAGSVRRACELWDDAGLLGPCGRELCRRVAGDLERAAAEAAGTGRSPVAVQVVLLDSGGDRMVGMYGRLQR